MAEIFGSWSRAQIDYDFFQVHMLDRVRFQSLNVVSFLRCQHQKQGSKTTETRCEGLGMSGRSCLKLTKVFLENSDEKPGERTPTYTEVYIGKREL